MIPFEFILDYLFPLKVRIKPMFGNHAIYINEKIYLATRKNTKAPLDNGIWIGTELNYHESLKTEFEALRHLQLFRIKKWLLLPESATKFEETAIKICELIKANDERFGIIPIKKRKH